MHTPFYNSPFPTMNPRVRYKTAMERAGFDVAYNGLDCSSSTASSTRGSRMRQHSEGSWMHGARSAPHLIGHSTQNRIRSDSGEAKRTANIPFNTLQNSSKSPARLPQINISSPNPHYIKTNRSVDGFAKESSFFDFERKSESKASIPSHYDELLLHSSNNTQDDTSSNYNSPTPKLPSPPSDFIEHELDPVERSFMMLTQNTVANPTKQTHTEKIFATSHEIQQIDRQLPEKVRDETLFESVHFEPEPALQLDLCSINNKATFTEPNNEPSNSIPLINVSEATPERLDVTSNYSESVSSNDEHNTRVKKDVPFFREHSEISQDTDNAIPQVIEETKNETQKGLSINGRASFASSEEFVPPQPQPRSQPEASTLSQVEKLIAQLDDVSLTRGLDVSESSPQTLSFPDEQRRKKSSAYLSRYEDNLNSTTRNQVSDTEGSLPYNYKPQMLHVSEVNQFPDEGHEYVEGCPSQEPVPSTNSKFNTPTSEHSADTPIFYNFKKTVSVCQNRSISSQRPDSDFDNIFSASMTDRSSMESFQSAKDKPLDMLQPSMALIESVDNTLQKPSIKPLHLSHKISISEVNNAKSEKLPDPEKKNLETQEMEQEGSKGDQEHTSSLTMHQPCPTPTFKHAPGEGPCRSCGLEVAGKRVFSKNHNELSGQWHRDCFRCIECGLKFSKKISCYILDDQPYCQCHYHQKNNSICKTCDGFIEGECLENDKNERFHVDCLTCFICHRLIDDDYYIYNNKSPLCHNHDIEALLRDGIDGEYQDMERSNTISKRRTRIINCR